MKTLTQKELCLELGISRQWFYELRKKTKFTPKIKWNGHYIFTENDLKFFKNLKIK